jgi:hypothetical protein
MTPFATRAAQIAENAETCLGQVAPGVDFQILTRSFVNNLFMNGQILTQSDFGESG